MPKRTPKKGRRPGCTGEARQREPEYSLSDMQDWAARVLNAAGIEQAK
jgi:hypothetical protein